MLETLEIWSCGFESTVFVFVFRRVRKIAAASFVIRVCLSVRMERLVLNWKDFREIWYLIVFRKSVKKIEVSCKPNMKNVYFTRIPMYIYDNCLFLARQPPVGQGLLIHEVSRSHLTTHHSR